jgi:hypothetical protein
VKDDDILHEGEAEAGAVPLGGEERPEDSIALRGLDAGTVVVHDDPHELLRLIDLRLNDDDRGERRSGARLDGIPEQVAERLPQQDLIALEAAELAADRDVAAQVRAWCAMSAALANCAQIDREGELAGREVRNSSRPG